MERKDNLWCYIATVFPLGKAKVAPGSFGSLAGIPLVFLYREVFPFSYLIWILFTLGLGVFAWFVIKQAEDFWGVHDDKSIVIDEVVGQFIALAPSTLAPMEVFIGYVSFRVLDVWKPGVIGWCDRNMKSPLGTLIDDILCGVLVALGFIIYNQFK